MRKKIVAGNWKMNKDYDESKHLVTKLLNSCKPGNAEVIIAPPFINLLSSIKILEDSSIKVAAQNMHYADSGAYTGEISGSMLKSIGVKHVILGHSERRAYFNETGIFKHINKLINDDLPKITTIDEENIIFKSIHKIKNMRVQRWIVSKKNNILINHWNKLFF